MKEFLYLKNGLRSLQPSTRLAYTLFLVFSLASYAVMALLAAERSGFSAESAANYYAGSAADATAYAKTKGELLEVTHFHLFTMPLMLFVQGHLFMMTRWPRPVKLALLFAAFLGAACDLAAPWLVVYVARDFAFVKIAGRCLLFPALLAFAFVPLWEMWTPAANGRAE